MFGRNLRGLRVQLLLWTVLPLTLVLVAVAVIGITVHDRSMRQMVQALNARSARQAAIHLSNTAPDEQLSQFELMTSDAQTDGTTMVLIDAAGTILAGPDLNQTEIDFSEHPAIEAIKRGETGGIIYRTSDRQEIVAGYAPVTGTGWGVIVQEPWEGLIAPVMRLSLLTPLVVVIAALVSGVAVTFGLRYIVHPLQSLDRLANRVAWGDFSATREPVGGIQEIEDLRRTLEGMAGQIQRYQSGMHDYIAAVTAAQEEERARLARELHDETVQSLIALGHRVEMAQKSLDKDPARTRTRLTELRALTESLQAEVRRFSRALRPLYLEDLGFVPALEMLAQEITRETGLEIEFGIEGNIRRLPADLELAVYRIAQESLSNVVRHAQATSARLHIHFEPQSLTMQVQDNGSGFEPPANPADLVPLGHFGLMGIHERALLFGGKITLWAKPGTGTTVEASLPLKNTTPPSPTE